MNNDDAAVRRARIGLGLGIPAFMVTLWAVPLYLWRDDLAAQLATHFDSSGVPDGSMSTDGFAALTGGLVAVGVLLCLVLASARRSWSDGAAPLIGLLGGFIGSLGSGLLLMTVTLQRGVVDWQQAPFSWTAMVGVIGLSLALGAFAARLAADLPRRDLVADDLSSPVMDLGPGERAVWTRRMQSRALLVGGIAAIVASVGVAVGTVWWVAFAGLCSGVAMLGLSTLRVRVDRQGLRVSYGLLPWPRTHISLRRIATARAMDVKPAEWGGWGYRGSLSLTKRAAVVHRAGPGLRVDLHDGKIFVVTVDDPQTAAALINAEVRRQTAATT